MGNTFHRRPGQPATLEVSRCRGARRRPWNNGWNSFESAQQLVAAGERAARAVLPQILRWFPQPAPQNHPWRKMPHHGMTPHTSGTSLSAQARYAAGTQEILECWFDGQPIRDEYLIVDAGKLAGTGAHSYSAGDATGGSDEAARFTT